MILALHIVATILLLLAALNVPSGSRVSVGWLGMFFWSLTIIWSSLHT
jgi:hypothetical protein